MLHHKKADDAKFVTFLPLIERASTDERNFVKKGVSWALRGSPCLAGHSASRIRSHAAASRGPGVP